MDICIALLLISNLAQALSSKYIVQFFHTETKAQKTMKHVTMNYCIAENKIRYGIIDRQCISNHVV